MKDKGSTERPIFLLLKGKFSRGIDTAVKNAPAENKLKEENLGSSTSSISLKDEEISQNDMHKAFSHVNTILFFIGYSRSRHTLLGSLLDAHPHMVVSDETNAFSRWQSNTDQWIQGSIHAYYDTLVTASERAITKGRRSHVPNDAVVNTSAFGYYVPNQWQGRFHRYIEVRQYVGNVALLQNLRSSKLSSTNLHSSILY